jgi:hypothetical protein
MPDIHEQYEGHLRRNIAVTNRRILQAYISAIQEVSNQVDKIKWNGQVFTINQFPALKQKIDAVINKMHPQVYGALVNSIKASWDLSNKKNNIIVDRRIAKRRPNNLIKQILYDPNKEALDRFIGRTEKGLNLSKRVWNTLEPFKAQLESGLGLAVANGHSAKETAKELKKYLVEPDKLFRRVRKDGRLRLSNAAKAYHPGQGVYRSSYKNALRLTRTENNMAYRAADYERWNNLPFVIGIEVKLSAAHPKYDICDRCKGVYPKDFKFSGWHPQCICYQVPKMVSDEEYDKIEDAILAGEEPDYSGINQVTNTPAGFDTWVTENRKRVEGWQNKPYWVKDNRGYYDNAGQGNPSPAVTKLKPAGKAVTPQFTQFDGPVKKQAVKALELIDLVHGDGDLKDIPVKKMATKGTQAQFAFTTTGAPLEIKVSTKATHPVFSMVHEMGHYFDLHAIGKKGVWDSQDNSSVVSTVLKVANESDVVKQLSAMLKNRAITIDGKAYPLSPSGVKYIKYLLEPHEIWARAYAQYIAKKSGNELLLDGLKDRLDRGATSAVPTQWDDANFWDIEKAIDEMMKRLGWVR